MVSSQHSTCRETTHSCQKSRPKQLPTQKSWFQALWQLELPEISKKWQKENKLQSTPQSISVIYCHIWTPLSTKKRPHLCRGKTHAAIAFTPSVSATQTQWQSRISTSISSSMDRICKTKSKKTLLSNLFRPTQSRTTSIGRSTTCSRGPTAQTVPQRFQELTMSRRRLMGSIWILVRTRASKTWSIPLPSSCHTLSSSSSLISFMDSPIKFQATTLTPATWWEEPRSPAITSSTIKATKTSSMSFCWTIRPLSLFSQKSGALGKATVAAQIPTKHPKTEKN